MAKGNEITSRYAYRCLGNRATGAAFRSGKKSCWSTLAIQCSSPAVSIWEISIKNPLNKREHGFTFSAEEAINRFVTSGFALLDITPRHAVTVETLPMIHRDPFDRLLVAQALREPMRLMTSVPVVARYSDTVILLQ